MSAANPLINLEVEQALLGIVLYQNSAYEALDGLSAEHFAEPFHGRLWAAIADAISQGRLAEPITIGGKLQSDPAFAELGGLTFLADLVDQAPPRANAPHYAKVLKDLAHRRDLISLSEEVIRAAKAGEGSTEDLIGIAEAGLLAMQVSSRPIELISVAESAAAVLDELDAPEEQAVGIKTGLEPLDEALGPLLPGNLILLMGRTSMGKSAAAECIAYNIACQGQGVIQVNCEMTPNEMTQRHLTDICQARWGNLGPQYRDIRRRRITRDQREMLEWARARLHGAPLMLAKRPGIKLSQIRSLARRQAAAWAKQGVKTGALIVDHVGLVNPDFPTRDRYADQTIVSNAMKELADELGCVVFGLNQMNRQNESREDKRPQLSDLRDSGAWEQDADAVIGFYREAYYAERRPEPKKDVEIAEWLRAKASRTVEAIILKARFGECTTISLWGDLGRNAIRGAAPEGDLI